MSHGSIPSYSSRDDHTSVVWFISFGDLLTLLVCFFFVLTPQLTFERNENVKKEALKLDGHTEIPSGTTFAYLPLGATGEVRVPSVTEGLERVGIRNDAWRTELAQVWESYRIRAAVQPRDVVVRVCSGSDQRSMALAMLLEIQGSQKQLRSWSLELEALCDKDEAVTSSSNKLVAVLEFSGS